MRLTKKIPLTMSMIFTITCLSAVVYFIQKRIITRNVEITKKLDNYYHLLGQWILNKTRNYDMSLHLRERGIYKVGIYGYGLMGKLLNEELKNCNVIYFIDKNADDSMNNCSNIPIIKPEEIVKKESVDAIIVTAYFYMNEIDSTLKKYLNNKDIPIISLEDLIYHDEYAEEK